MEHPIRYNAFFGVFLLMAGLFTLGVGIFVGKAMLLLLGSMNALVGLGFTTRPFAVVTSRGVEMRNLLGMTMRLHEVPREHLAVKHGAVVDSRSGKKLVGGMLARREDVDALERSLSK
ncbi:MAG: hypothetical protein H6721_27565 [Sandaracinus sp.]|nr:hypothetical protein [Myxococcales bacterium]MCB9600485.1 hypothetical protein [Sandaracinus sp.]MCB9635894.1 hypothetical protein [Sandaracinus sp.]